MTSYGAGLPPLDAAASFVRYSLGRLAAVVGQLDVDAVGRLDVLLELVDEDRVRGVRPVADDDRALLLDRGLDVGVGHVLVEDRDVLRPGRGAGGGRRAAARRGARPAAGRRSGAGAAAARGRHDQHGDEEPAEPARRHPPRSMVHHDESSSWAGQRGRPLLGPRAERCRDPVADAVDDRRRSRAGRRRSCTAGPRGGHTRRAAASPSRSPPSRSPSPRAGCRPRRDGASRSTRSGSFSWRTDPR